MTRKQFAVIIHGKGGSPDTSWVPWLKQKLEHNNYVSIAPAFPSQDDSKLLDWFTEFNKLNIDFSHTTFVAHARGAMALLRWINSLPSNIRIQKIITISCNFDFQPNRKDGDAFYSRKLNYADLKQKCKSFIVIHSEDDPYVPIKAGAQLSQSIGAKLVQYKHAGHFGSNKKEAPEILKEILEVQTSSI